MWFALLTTRYFVIFYAILHLFIPFYFRLLFIAYQALSGNRPLQSQIQDIFPFIHNNNERERAERARDKQHSSTTIPGFEYNNTIIYEVVTTIKINFEISSSSASESTAFVCC